MYIVNTQVNLLNTEAYIVNTEVNIRNTEAFVLNTLIFAPQNLKKVTQKGREEQFIGFPVRV